MDRPRIHDDSLLERAYGLWAAEGCPDGSADRHWSDATGVAGRSRRRV